MTRGGDRRSKAATSLYNVQSDPAPSPPRPEAIRRLVAKGLSEPTPDPATARSVNHEQYAIVVRALDPVLYNRPAKIVAIDGRPGAGKTTLGRYLAWHFGVSLLETDLFRRKPFSRFVHINKQVDRLINKRLKKSRPIIVEGATVLRLLGELGRQPDFVIYVANVACSDINDYDVSLAADIAGYEAQFRPQHRADLCITLEPELGE